MPENKLNQLKLNEEEIQRILSPTQPVIIRKTWICDWDQWILKKWRDIFKKEA